MMTNITHGYLASGGNLAMFDFPFSISTQAWDLSASGRVVGAYTDAAKKTHGFLLTFDDLVGTFGVDPPAGVNGKFSFMSIDYPGAAATQTRGITVVATWWISTQTLLEPLVLPEPRSWPRLGHFRSRLGS